METSWIRFFVAFLRFAKKHEVVITIGIGAGFVTLLRDVNFAADDRVHAFFGSFVVELDCAEEVAMIGHSNGRHVLFLNDVYELLDITGAVEKRVIGMAVKVNERGVRTFGASFSVTAGAKER